jgi:hypothetical protein
MNGSNFWYIAAQQMQMLHICEAIARQGTTFTPS